VHHLDDVRLALDKHGFSGIYYLSVRRFHPSFCIFCLYDGDAGLSTQFADFYTGFAFKKHLEKHLRDLNDDVSIVCPATTDTANGIRAVCHRTEAMSKDALVAHLTNEHKLAIDSNNTCFKAMRKRARPVLGEKNVNEAVHGANGSTWTMSNEDKSMD
jgi:hypothetical protein